MRPRREDDLWREGLTRRLDEIIRLLRRIECRLAEEPAADDLKTVIFDEDAPNGRLA